MFNLLNSYDLSYHAACEDPSIRLGFTYDYSEVAEAIAVSSAPASTSPAATTAGSKNDEDGDENVPQQWPTATVAATAAVTEKHPVTNWWFFGSSRFFSLVLGALLSVGCLSIYPALRNHSKLSTLLQIIRTRRFRNTPMGVEADGLKMVPADTYDMSPNDAHIRASVQ